jgi:hypothetical protein
VRRRIVDQSAREAFEKHCHILDHLKLDPRPRDTQLSRLEAGLPVVTQGWTFGYHGYESYCLEPDGSVTSVEAVYVDPDAMVRTVENYKRPDGSLVYSDKST